jgi:signal transduction histidine kinase
VGLNIRQKMSIIVGTVATSFALLISVSWLLDAETEKQAAVIRDRYIPHVELGYRLQSDFEGISLSLRDAVAAQDGDSLESAQNLKNKLIADLDSASNIIDTQQSDTLKLAIDDYFSSAINTSKRLIKGETGLSIVESMSHMQTKRSIAEIALNKVTIFDRGKLSESFDSIFRAQRRSARTRLWISLGCVFLVLFSSLFTVRYLISRLKDIEMGLSRFGIGDFKQPIPVVGNDELAELSRQINSMANQIQRLLQEIESFSYSVAHDLRAPLRAVQGFVTIITEEHTQSLTADAKSLMSRVVIASQRMEKLIEGLLSLTRLNRTAIKKQHVDLSKITHAVLGILKDNDPERKIRIDVEANVVGWGDPHLLDVTISNLVSNAWKFTKRAADAQVQFGTLVENKTTVFFIRDNGAGFDMRYSKKLFGTFQRLHTESEFEGHGIGLATVKNIIEKHGGRIWAESEPGKGATFYFTLS